MSNNLNAKRNGDRNLETEKIVSSFAFASARDSHPKKKSNKYISYL